jgi:hypothetical protein
LNRRQHPDSESGLFKIPVLAAIGAETTAIDAALPFREHAPGEADISAQKPTVV